MSKDLISLIKEYHETYKTNPVYIPLATFKSKGVDENNITLSIEKLQQDEIIEESHNVFGYYTKQYKISQLEHGKFSEHSSYLKKVASEPTEEQAKWHFDKILDYIPDEQELIEEPFENMDDEFKKFFKPFIEIKINSEKLYQQIPNKKSTLLHEHSTKIKNIDILQDTTELKEITIFINIAYGKPLHYRRGKNWEKMYNLAKEQSTSYNKGFFDYFNSNSHNPLYAKEKYRITKILKKESDTIVPNIEIKIVTQNKISRRLKSA